MSKSRFEANRSQAFLSSQATRMNVGLALMFSFMLISCGPLQNKKGEDASISYDRLRAGGYALTQMEALNSRTQGSKKTTSLQKAATQKAYLDAKTLLQSLQDDYSQETKSTETDNKSTSTSANANAVSDDTRSLDLSKKLRSSARSALTYAATAGVKVTDVDPSSSLDLVEQAD